MDTIGPRKVGGRYLNGYWRQSYTVIAIFDWYGQPWMIVKWEDGNQTSHCTAWDERRDRILAEPDGWSVVEV